MSNKTENLEIVENLRNGYYPPPDIPKETLRVYANALADIDPDVLRGASLLLAKTCRFWPSIAEIRTACLELSGERASLPSVGEAYAEARRAASSIGSYVKPVADDFTHAIVYRAAVQASGSWRRWCLTDQEAPLRAKFFDVYRELRLREIQQQALPESKRCLTAEESRQLLEDISTRADRQPKRLSAGAAEALKPLHELLRSNPPRGLTSSPRIVGDDLSPDEWRKKKAAVLERAKVS